MQAQNQQQCAESEKRKQSASYKNWVLIYVNNIAHFSVFRKRKMRYNGSLQAPMNAFHLLVIGMIVGGVLSPLLTFSALFQQKEWRFDRLKEHLRSEGVLTQLWGRARLILLGAYLFLILLLSSLLSDSFIEKSIATMVLIFGVTIFFIIVLLFCLSILQLALKKQRMPVWTSKAMLIVSLSLLMTGAFMLAGQNGEYVYLYPLLVFLQPFIVMIATICVLPLDILLKKKLMKKASDVRAELQSPTVIAIAGSVGKTTTKELIAHLLQDLKPHVTPAHVNTEMGVSQWLISQESRVDSHQVLIVEMGAYRKGEIKLLCEIVQPTIGVMTALGSDHLALFGSEEAILDANAELLEALPKDGHVFLNEDNEGVKTIKDRAQCPVTCTGVSKNADVRATEVQETMQGIAATIQLHTTHYTLQTPLHGIHNIQNILLAVAVAQHMGIANNRIKELLQTFKAPDHTFNVRTQSGITILDDTYNISPLSFNAALNWANMQEGTPKVLLTSGLLETGSSEEKFLLELGKHASTIFNRAIFTTNRGRKTFSSAFGKEVELLHADTNPVPKNAVLACVGRMPQSTIERLLPDRNEASRRPSGSLRKQNSHRI